MQNVCNNVSMPALCHKLTPFKGFSANTELHHPILWSVDSCYCFSISYFEKVAVLSTRGRARQMGKYIYLQLIVSPPSFKLLGYCLQCYSVICNKSLLQSMNPYTNTPLHLYTLIAGMLEHLTAFRKNTKLFTFFLLQAPES